MLPEEENWLKELPPDFRPSQREIEQAYGLFGERNGIRPDLRVLLGSYDGKASLVLRIIIDNRLCLFFYGDSGRWKFDGYECGNYEDYWTEFDWEPYQKGKGKKTMIGFGWLVDKFSDKAVKKLVDKYRPRAIWSVVFWAILVIIGIVGTCKIFVW